MIENEAEEKSAFHRAAASLRDMCFSAKDGTFLGSEEDLVKKLGVSRPTLRQAAAMLSREQLMQTRRGVSGGYFVSLPRSSSVSRMAANYLRSRDAVLTDIVRAVEPIRTELARLASRKDDADRQKLRAFLDEELEDESGDYRAFLKSERELGRTLGETADNELLSLFLAITYDLAALQQSEDVYLNRPERVEHYRKLRNQMVEAIIEGDEPMAVLLTRRCNDVVTDWINEDLEQSLEANAKGGAKRKRKPAK